jgi:hypothetical protein
MVGRRSGGLVGAGVVNRDRAVSDRKKRERERELNITFSLS